MDIEECKKYKKPYKKHNMDSHFETLFTMEEINDKIKNIYCNTKKYDNDNIPDIITKTKILDKLTNKKYILSDNAIENTIKHFFNRDFGGWLFIAIKNNKIDMLYNIYNINFSNNWSHLLQPINVRNYLISKMKSMKKFYNLKNIKPHNKFNNNGCLINMLDYHAMPGSYQLEFVDMLTETLKHRKIKDTCFIFSTKDFPALKLSPEKWIHPDQSIPLYNEYIPVFSQSTTFNHLDIPVPCDMDWHIVSQKAFPDDCTPKNITAIPDIPWNDKINIAFFRGSSTGCFFDNKNPRIKIHRLSNQYPQYLDAGIIFFVQRDQIHNGVIYHAGMFDNSDIILKKPVPMPQQSKYKYVINIKGNSAAYRLPFLFYLKSVVIIVETDFKLWFENLLIPFTHFVPVKSDLSDLIDKIIWLNNNDDKAKQIALNGFNFISSLHSKQNIFDYLAFCINSI